MGAVMAEEHKVRSTHDEDSQIGHAKEQCKRPYDTSGIDWTPKHQQDDPPYRDWWVIEEDRE
jgi:hypothetical protein